MKALLLLILVPCLIAADTPCTDSNISCPDDKRCCEVDGQPTCCDVDDEAANVHVLEGKMKVYAGDDLLRHAGQYPNASVRIGRSATDGLNGIIPGGCKFYNCIGGKCCGKFFCCEPGGKWSCCPDNKCCPPETICCPVGCCPKRQECCGGGCCAVGQKCCGSWCCKKKQQCGNSYNTCYGKGASFTPAIATVLLLAAASVLSRHL